MFGARRADTFLIRLPIVAPEAAFRDIRRAKFPVFLRLVNAREKALALLILRKMEEEFDDMRSVRMKVLLQIYN